MGDEGWAAGLYLIRPSHEVQICPGECGVYKGSFAVIQEGPGPSKGLEEGGMFERMKGKTGNNQKGKKRVSAGTAKAGNAEKGTENVKAPITSESSAMGLENLT